MKQPGIFKIILSYLFPIHLRKYPSQYSGDLYITLENGKKMLNTHTVNYSFNSLHRVFKHAFKKTRLQINNHDSTLLLGLGGGSIVQILRKDYEISGPIAVVEIDPAIIMVATEEFNIHQYNPITIHEMDAFEFVQDNQDTFNLICVDLFIQDIVPAKFLSIDFVQKLLDALQKDGTIYFNIMLSNETIQT